MLNSLAPLVRIVTQVAVAAAITAAFAPSPCLGQEDNLDGLSGQLKQLSELLPSRDDLDEATRSAIQSDLDAVKALLEESAAVQEETEQLRQATASAEARAQQLGKDLADLKASQPASPDTAMEDRALADEIVQKRQLLENLKASVKQNELQSAERLQGRQDSRQALETLSDKISELQNRLAGLEPVEDLANRTSQLKLRSQLFTLQADKQKLEAQLARNEAEAEFGFLKEENELLRLQVERLEEYLRQLEEVQSTRRQEMAQRSAAEAAIRQQEIERTNPLLVSSYEINTRLARRVGEVEEQVAKLTGTSAELEKQVSSLRQKLDATRIRVDAIGATASIGTLLRSRRLELADILARGQVSEDVRPQIEAVQNELFNTDQARRELDRRTIIQEIQAANEQPEITDRQQLAENIDAVIEDRKQYLDATKVSLNRLLNRLIDIQQYESELQKVSREFRVFINEKILWIRSNKLLLSEWGLDTSDRIVLDPNSWQTALWQIGQALGMAPLGDDHRDDRNQLESIWELAAEPGGNGDAATDQAPSSREPAAWQSMLRLPLTTIGSLVCLVLFIVRLRLINELRRLGDQASRAACTRFWPTLRATAITVLIALPYPLVLLLLGLAIQSAPFEGTRLFRAIGFGLVSAGALLLFAELLRCVCREDGLARSHFSWPDASVDVLKRNVDRLVLPLTLITFCVEVLYRLDQEPGIDLLERSLFCGGMLLATFHLYKIFNPRRGIFSPYLRGHEQNWANQTSFLWLGAILLAPLVLAWLAFVGYYYTAWVLTHYTFTTLVFALGVETTRALSHRLVLLRRREAFIASARRKVQAQLEAQQKLQEQVEAGAENGPPGDILESTPFTGVEVDREIQPEEIEANVKQAYKMISLGLLLAWVVGLWFIWFQVLPALKSLDEYTLWPSQGVAQSSPVENSPPTVPIPGSPSPANLVAAPGSDSTTAPAASDGTTLADASAADPGVTVRDLLVFFMIAAMTIVLAWNLPSAFEVLFMKDLPVDRSFRHAVKSIISYLIVIVGIIFAFRALSISWTSVQWLATALTFGLAFGLQEIFANFFAGVILMFERPMRIGDLITVDQFTGYVTKIRTRATTIVNWDRKEYVIPNKDFITGRFVNWTLSDVTNRIELRIGIAYGSDVVKAKQLVLKLVTQHPLTLEDPPPHIVFDEFGASSLNLISRAFVSNIDVRLQAIDELHTQIYEVFAREGIEIAFPQLDLHVRSVDSQAQIGVRHSNE